MTRLEQALLDFVRTTQRQPVVIYMGWEVLKEVRMSDICYQLDLANNLYQGIPWFRVANADNHLAIY